MKMNELTFDEMKTVASYDPVSGVLYRISSQRKDCIGKVTTLSGTGYIVFRYKDIGIQGHRLAWALYHGKWPTLEIDHIDRDKTNNRIENLREATNGEQEQNKGIRSDNSSGSTGVYWHKTRGKWRAYISVNGNTKHLGSFDTKELASEAREAGKLKYHTFNPTLVG